MSDQNKEEHVLSRRDALKTLAVATGATALTALPGKWETPLIEVGALPAFAQASPTSYDFSSIVELGQPGSGVSPQQNRGWIAVVVDNGQVQSIQSAGAVEAQAFTIIPPIVVSQRNFSAPAPSWTIGGTLTLSYTFISETNVFPADGTELILYGISGAFYFDHLEATITAIVVDHVVIFNFGLPATYSGIFYFSANFVEETIVLTNTVEIDIRSYQAPVIYGILASYNKPLFSDPPILLGGNFTLYGTPNQCDMGDGGEDGSQTQLDLTYTGGNLDAGTQINLLTMFLPSGDLSLVTTEDFTINPPVISTIDHCIRFSDQRVIYLTVWITDADGKYSNSLANFFLAGPGLNSTDASLAGPPQK